MRKKYLTRKQAINLIKKVKPKKIIKREKIINRPEVTGWSIELEWSNGKKENWADCDSYFDTQVVDDGITEYQEEKYPSKECQHGNIDPKSNMCNDCNEEFY